MEHILKKKAAPNGVCYEPGVLKAVCGEAECSIQTAGKAVELSANVWHAEETINKEK